MSTKQFLATLAAGVALACGTSVASAAIPVFCVNDTQLGGVGAPVNGTLCAGAGSNVGTTGFSVDLLQGAYVEKVLVTAVNAFQATIVFDINSYNFGGSTITTALDNLPPAGYNLYAVVTTIGTFSGTTFTATSATLDVYGDADQNANLGFSGISDANLAFTGGAGDVLLGSTTNLLNGSGTLVPAGGQDGFAVLFGDFALTAGGDTFFIAPRPFYVEVFSDGDITDSTFNPNPGAVTQLQGEASANFQLTVPEPGSLALAGLALLGLGAARRRKI